MQTSRLGHVHRRGTKPRIGGGVIAPPVVVKDELVVQPTPEDHFFAGPNGGDALAIIGGVDRVRCRPAISQRIVAAARWIAWSAPRDHHFLPRPNRRMQPAQRGRIYQAGRRPRVGGWVITPTAQVVGGIIDSTPYDHLGATPNRGVPVTSVRSAGGTDHGPCIGCRVVASAIPIKLTDADVVPGPHEHLRTRPHGWSVGTGRQ